MCTKGSLRQFRWALSPPGLLLVRRCKNYGEKKFWRNIDTVSMLRQNVTLKGRKNGKGLNFQTLFSQNMIFRVMLFCIITAGLPSPSLCEPKPLTLPDEVPTLLVPASMHTQPAQQKPCASLHAGHQVAHMGLCLPSYSQWPISVETAGDYWGWLPKAPSWPMAVSPILG